MTTSGDSLVRAALSMAAIRCRGAVEIRGAVKTLIASPRQVGHGRVETRITSVITDTDWICNQQDWENLCSLIKVEAKRYDKKSGKEQNSERYFISSKKATAAYFHQAAKVHWQIENNLHWVLDVTFSEDSSRVRINHAVENFALLRKIALNLLSKNDSPGSIRGKRKIAGWNDDFLVKVLTG